MLREEWLTGIHTAFEESIAWRIYIGINLHRPPVSCIGESASVHKNGAILLQYQISSAFLLCQALADCLRRSIPTIRFRFADMSHAFESSLIIDLYNTTIP